jgi:hypothetical protein
MASGMPVSPASDGKGVRNLFPSPTRPAGVLQENGPGIFFSPLEKVPDTFSQAAFVRATALAMSVRCVKA